MQPAPESESRPTPRTMLLAFGFSSLAAGAIAIFLLYSFGIDGLMDQVLEGWQWLQDAPPIVFFGAMSILTIGPVPLSPFYIAAGSLYGTGPALLWIPPAIVLNNLIAYTLTTSVLRPWLQSLVAKRGFSIPTLASKRQQTLFIVMVRITPGPPYFVQSLVLGLAGVDRLRFLVVSLPVHMVYVVGFVVLGQSAFEGELGLAILAVALILGASVLARLAHKHLKAAADVETDTENATPVD